MTEPHIIEWHRSIAYGVEREYVSAPESARLVELLTGRKTITEQDRRALTALVGVEWREVLAPKRGQ
jgi:hypothetical protein